jgi:ElaB/YqjD/DUF883 family membrane-anchored ribosome-binding protein
MHDPLNHAADPVADFAAKAGEAKDAIGSCYASAPAAVKSAACDAKQRLTEAGSQALQTVRRYPVETAVIALGAGVLVWWLMTRRSGSTP